MCGIIGAWGNIVLPVFEKGLDRIAHRGPDGSGIYHQEQVQEQGQLYLGHRRLSILDLSPAGKQPFQYAHLTITFNGEIYNFLELRAELQQKGYSFRSQTDTEVLLAAYLEWGAGCLDKMNGMWAFAIWDDQHKHLFMSRDRFGKKPLFYSFTREAFVFGSEMKAITPFLDEVRPSAHFNWCLENMLRYESTDKCLVEGIRRFPAGSYAIVKPGDRELTPVKFWDTRSHLVKVPAKYEQQVEEFRELFIDACSIRMRSDVPIGTALSGGVDSSAVICTMNHISKTRNVERQADLWQHAFVACFKGTPQDERHYAEKVVDHLHIPATYLEIDPIKGIENLDHYLYLIEELYLTSPIPMMETYKAIRQNGVVVSIDGHGADELMAGYRNQVTLALLDAKMNIQKSSQVLGAYQGLFDENNTQEHFPGRGLREWYRQMTGHLKGRKNFLKYLLQVASGKDGKAPGSSMGAYNETLYELFHVTVLPTLLRNYDRYAMASGVEIRMPFLDHRLASYTFSLPWDSKIRNGFTKSLIRDAAAPYMPHEIAYRKSKVGFNTPVVDWIKGPWRNFMLDTVNSTDFRNSSLVDTASVRQGLNDFLSSETPSFGQGEAVWNSFTPYFWEKAFLKAQ